MSVYGTGLDLCLRAVRVTREAAVGGRFLPASVRSPPGLRCPRKGRSNDHMHTQAIKLGLVPPRRWCGAQ